MLDSLATILATEDFFGLDTAGLLSDFTTSIASNFSGTGLGRVAGHHGAVSGVGGAALLLAAFYLANRHRLAALLLLSPRRIAGPGWHSPTGR